MRPHLTLALACSLGSALGCSNPPAVTAPPATPETPAVTPPVTPPPVTPPTTPPPGPPRDNVTPGSATPVDPGSATPGLNPTTRLSDPTMNDDRVGRAPRRLNVRQLRASLLTAVGVTWRQPRRMLSADYANGYYDDPSADMFEVLALTLGQPDFNGFTNESIDPGAVFSKLVGDGARKACRDGLTLDVARAPGARLLLRNVSETDTLASNEAGVRQNVAHLVMRFWARPVAPADAAVTDLVALFRTASTAPASTEPMLPAGAPLDGWRAVCIALATDPQFLTY